MPSKRSTSFLELNGVEVFDIITIHVDDIKGSSTNGETAEKLLRDIRSLFGITVNKEEEPFLGVITRRLSNGDLIMEQSAYAQRILKRFGMEDCKPVTTPMTRDILSKKDCPTTPEDIADMADKNTLYRSILGSLNYLAQWTRPDLSYMCSQLSRFSNNPGKLHLECLKRALRYLQGTIDQGIVFSSNLNNPNMTSFAESAEIYVDADYASNPDTRKSTTGIYVLVNGRAIYWYSKSQAVIAQSTAEAEYMALAQASKEALWLRKLQRDFRDEPTSPTLIHEDNQACIKIAMNPESFSRTKHIDQRYHIVRERINRKEISLIYTPTREQAADMLTKALGLEDLQRCLRVVGL
jgi:hypothetical protein